MKESVFLAAFAVICVVLVAYSGLQQPEKVYVFDELGEVALTVKGAEGYLTIAEIGTFDVSICSGELCREFTIATNETTDSFGPMIVRDFDFSQPTTITITWQEMTKTQVVEI